MPRNSYGTKNTIETHIIKTCKHSKCITEIIRYLRNNLKEYNVFNLLGHVFEGLYFAVKSAVFHNILKWCPEFYLKWPTSALSKLKTVLSIFASR